MSVVVCVCDSISCFRTAPLYGLSQSTLYSSKAYFSAFVISVHVAKMYSRGVGMRRCFHRNRNGQSCALPTVGAKARSRIPVVRSRDMTRRHFYVSE